MFGDESKLEEKSNFLKKLLSKFKINNFETFTVKVLLVVIILFFILLLFVINIIKSNDKSFKEEKELSITNN